MINEFKTKTLKTFWPRSTMDSIRVSEALDPRSIRGEATKPEFLKLFQKFRFLLSKNPFGFIFSVNVKFNFWFGGLIL